MAAVKGQTQNTTKTMWNADRVSKMQEEAGLLMKPYASWEEFLMPAPACIAILGKLMCSTSEQGPFTLQESSSNADFTQVDPPKHFKTHLHKLSNHFWEAFNEAHTTMGSIKDFSESAVTKMKNFIQSFQEADVAKALSLTSLNKIKKRAEKCTTYVGSVKTEFSAVTKIIHKLLEDCLETKKSYEDKLRDVQGTLEQAKKQEEAAKKAKEVAEQHLKQMGQQLEKTFNQYKMSLKSIPSGWEAIKVSIKQNMINVLLGQGANFLNKLAENCGFSIGDIEGEMAKLLSMSTSSPETTICVRADELLEYAKWLKNVTSNGRLQMDLIFDQKSQNVKIHWIKHHFQSQKNELIEQVSCKAKQEAQEICQLGISICEELEQIALSQSTEEEKQQKVIEDICELHQKAFQFTSYSKDFVRAPAFPFVEGQEDSHWHGIEQVKENVKQREMMFKTTQEKYEKGFEDLVKWNEELTKVHCDIKQYEMRKIDFEMLVTMLIEESDVLQKMNRQWEKMGQLIQMISSLLDFSSCQDIQEYLGSMESVQAVDYSSKILAMDLVCTQVFSAISVAQLVYMISNSYKKLSDDHLMPGFQSLQDIISTKSSSFDAAYFENAQRAIYKEVENAKDDFKNNIQARIEKLRMRLPSENRGELKTI